MSEQSRLLAASLPEQEYRTALDNCVRYGWLQVMDRAAIDEVRELLRDDPAVLAVPQHAEPDEGAIDFTPAGAVLYRMISADWLGPDWEDSLRVSRGYYWEDHY